LGPTLWWPALVIEGTDADSFAYSLSNLAEIIFPCLEAVKPRGVVEVGAFKATTTRDLLEWADQVDCSVTTVEPVPREELLELQRERPELELVKETSLDALRHIELGDAIILDGDHNHYTLSNELRLIDGRAERFPLVFLHDVSWPLARRDAYEAPDQIPEQYRQPLSRGVGLAPGEAGVVDGGLYYSCVASREGGPRNGVLTAIEDFMSERSGLRLAVIPAFFGLGVLWPEDAFWAEDVEALVAPWDRNPMVERLEENRIWHLIARLDLDHELDRARAGTPASRRLSTLRRRLSGRA
jgi:hypothetical protein